MGRKTPNLPVEILSEILEYLPESNLLDVTTVSRTFHGICTRKLYKEVYLKGFKRFKLCVETLAFNQTAASYVKSLAALVSGAEVTPMFTRSLRAALQNVALSVTHLGFTCTDNSLKIGHLLRRISFPKLSVFRINEPLDKELAVFLQNNDRIETLSVGYRVELPVKGRGRAKDYHRDMRIGMPRLRHFRGPSQALSIFLPNSSVDEVEIIGDTTAQWMEALSMTAVPLQVLSMKCSLVMEEAVLNHIRTNLTHLTELKMHCYQWDSQSPFVTKLAAVVPNLPKLRSLLIFNEWTSRQPTYLTLEEDYRCIQNLTANQERLTMIETPVKVQWARLKKSGQWIPLCSQKDAVRWLYARTGLHLSLQNRIFRVFAIGPAAILNVIDRTVPPEPTAERKDAAITEIGRAAAKFFNRVYKVDGEGEDKDEDERLRVPIRSGNNRVHRPYVDRIGDVLPGTESMTEIWDGYCTLLGMAAMHPVEYTTMRALADIDDVLGDDHIPVLDETQRETLDFIMTLLWCAMCSMELEIWHFLRNPEQEWTGTCMFHTLDSVTTV
ncbi:hypothetical protein CC2G_003307 [Coprinopsis cinerea AmutBmut pab1-1]|nr:hypothetical protein CC2G_003307 [Coprinopsis cinerea AmutBmut pab1-1]